MGRVIKCKLRDIRLLEHKQDNASEFARFLGVEVYSYMKWEKYNVIPKLRTALEVSEKLKKHVDEIWHLE